MLKKFFVCLLIFAINLVYSGCFSGESNNEVVCCELEINYDNDVITGKATYSNFCHLVKDNS